MGRHARHTSFVRGMAFIATLAAGQGVAATAEQLRWLAGCWASDAAGSGEVWLAPAGGMMLGIGRQVREGRVVSYEWLRIVETADESLDYVAIPSGQAETRFRLADLGERQVAFANPDHDFPQRIRYRREADSLFARIEGERRGEVHAVDFPMTRAACPGD